MHRLTVSLVRMVPPTRRQVEVWSDLTLAGLHEVIQVLFDWDGDHLYEFVVGRRRYADPYYLEACEDDEVSLAEVAGRAGKVISYTYDLGACWEHRIVVDAVEPARAGTRFARCVAGVGPHPAEYDHDRPRRLDLDALNKPEVAGALQALRLPAPPAGFHSARHLPRLDACWRLAEDLGLLDISSKDAIPGPGLAALEDDGQTLELWTSLWELAAVDGRVLIYEGSAVGYLWVTPPLLWALWRAEMPMSAAELALVRPGHDQVGFVAWVLDQLVAVGGVERLGDGRYQLTPLGRHGHLAVLDHDPRGSAWR